MGWGFILIIMLFLCFHLDTCCFYVFMFFILDTCCFYVMFLCFYVFIWIYVVFVYFGMIIFDISHIPSITHMVSITLPPVVISQRNALQCGATVMMGDNRYPIIVVGEQ